MSESHIPSSRQVFGYGYERQPRGLEELTVEDLGQAQGQILTVCIAAETEVKMMVSSWHPNIFSQNTTSESRQLDMAFNARLRIS